MSARVGGCALCASDGPEPRDPCSFLKSYGHGWSLKIEYVDQQSAGRTIDSGRVAISWPLFMDSASNLYRPSPTAESGHQDTSLWPHQIALFQLKRKSIVDKQTVA